MLVKMSNEMKCGCKGIRTCLLCEQKSNACVKGRDSKEIKYIYTYCPECNLCWPDNEETASVYDSPLYLEKLKLHLNFLTEEEETAAITAIDKIPWVPSQSGRRKQDFGPKVNFKKKKVKIGEFNGFPKFTENTLRRFQDIPELSDFQPVELCHLEYSPERGSSIDPHVDDFWLWGERLVTINLGSSTVLTLVPCSGDVCECYQRAHTLFKGNEDRNFSCNHEFHDTYLVRNTMKTLSVKDISSKYSSGCAENSGHDSKHTKLSSTEELPVASTLVPKSNTSGDILHPAYQSSHKSCKMLNSNIDSACDSKCSSKIFASNVEENVNQQNDYNIASVETSPVTFINDFHPSSCGKNVNTMCKEFRTGVGDFKVAVRIVLPPRSLLVLAGCARYNWFHEIKRKDVVSRRLAMTFRELTAEFLDGGRESQIGKDLLRIANKFV